MIDRNEATCDNVSAKIETKVKLLDEKIKELREIKKLLVKGIENCQGANNKSKPAMNCPIIVAQKFEKNLVRT